MGESTTQIAPIEFCVIITALLVTQKVWKCGAGLPATCTHFRANITRVAAVPKVLYTPEGVHEHCITADPHATTAPDRLANRWINICPSARSVRHPIIDSTHREANEQLQRSVLHAEHLSMLCQCEQCNVDASFPQNLHLPARRAARCFVQAREFLERPATSLLHYV